MPSFPISPRTLADSAKADRDDVLDRLAQRQYETAALYLKMDEPQAATIYFQLLLKEYPDSKRVPKARLELAKSYALLDQFDRARESLDSLKTDSLKAAPCGSRSPRSRSSSRRPNASSRSAAPAKPPRLARQALIRFWDCRILPKPVPDPELDRASFFLPRHLFASGGSSRGSENHREVPVCGREADVVRGSEGRTSATSRSIREPVGPGRQPVRRGWERDPSGLGSAWPASLVRLAKSDGNVLSVTNRASGGSRSVEVLSGFGSPNRWLWKGSPFSWGPTTFGDGSCLGRNMPRSIQKTSNAT